MESVRALGGGGSGPPAVARPRGRAHKRTRVDAERQVGGQGPGGGGPCYQGGAVGVPMQREAHDDGRVYARGPEEVGSGRRVAWRAEARATPAHEATPKRHRSAQTPSSLRAPATTHSPSPPPHTLALTRHILVVLPCLKVGQRGGAARGVGHDLRRQRVRVRVGQSVRGGSSGPSAELAGRLARWCVPCARGVQDARGATRGGAAGAQSCSKVAFSGVRAPLAQEVSE